MKRPALWIAVALFLVSLSLIEYRVLRLGYPLFPTSPVKAWGLSMEVFFEPTVKDGKEMEIPTRDLVPGDLVLIEDPVRQTKVVLLQQRSLPSATGRRRLIVGPH